MPAIGIAGVARDRAGAFLSATPLRTYAEICPAIAPLRLVFLVAPLRYATACGSKEFFFSLRWTA